MKWEGNGATRRPQQPIPDYSRRISQSSIAVRRVLLLVLRSPIRPFSLAALYMPCAPTPTFRSSSLWRYGLTVVFVAAGLLLTFLLQNVFSRPFWFLFLAAVVASAWVGGKGPGWLAVALSTLAVEHFFSPRHAAWRIHQENIPFIVAFAACAVFVSWLSSGRRRMEAALKEARDELEARVEQRTAELKKTNEALLAEIAERKRTQEVLNQAQASLAHMNRVMSMGELTASIAHEVNQPLAAVVTSANACQRWLAADPPNIDKARAAVDRIVEAGNRAGDVVGRVRALFKKTAPVYGLVDVNEVIREMAGLLQADMTRHNVSMHTELAGDLPPVQADRVQLQQVVLNLAMNGIDAMKETRDRPRELHIASRKEGSEEVLVTIHDSGVGLSPEQAERIFEPFFTTKAQGIGMGLPICRSIIEAHGGRLWAMPSLSQGATFQYVLPAKIQNANE